MTRLAIDIGGSGCRLSFRGDGAPVEPIEAPGLSVGPNGIDARTLVDSLVMAADAALRAARTEQPTAIAIGMSGLLGLVPSAAPVIEAVRARWAESRIVVASDAVTALIGALGMGGGAVVAAGTGVVGFGSDLDRIWHRVDGWGHVLGDEGGGAWIGAEGLRIALRHFDARSRQGDDLRTAAEKMYGDLRNLPRAVYTRDDRAGVLARFAPSVIELARASDAKALDIVLRAGQRLGVTALAGLQPGVPPRVTLVGGIASAWDIFGTTFRQTIADSRPDAEVVAPIGDPLSGASVLADMLATDADTVHHHPPYITKDCP